MGVPFVQSSESVHPPSPGRDHAGEGGGDAVTNFQQQQHFVCFLSLPPPPFSPPSSLLSPFFTLHSSLPSSSVFSFLYSCIPAFFPPPPHFLTYTSKTVAPSLFVVLSVPEYIICDRRLAERKSDYLPCVSIKSGISALFSLLPLEANPLHPLFTCLFHLFH